MFTHSINVFECNSLRFWQEEEAEQRQEDIKGKEEEKGLKTIVVQEYWEGLPRGRFNQHSKKGNRVMEPVLQDCIGDILSLKDARIQRMVRIN